MRGGTASHQVSIAESNRVELLSDRNVFAIGEFFARIPISAFGYSRVRLKRAGVGSVAEFANLGLEVCKAPATRERTQCHKVRTTWVNQVQVDVKADGTSGSSRNNGSRSGDIRHTARSSIFFTKHRFPCKPRISTVCNIKFTSSINEV